MSPRNTGTKKSRFTFWLPDETQKQLKRLQRATGKESVADVIRDAISVYKELLKAREDDVDLYFEDRKTGQSGRIWILPGPPPVSSRKK